MMDYKTGDRVSFHENWDPGFAPDDPFYVQPIPQGTVGKILDIGKDHLRIRLEDTAQWPNPVIVWFEGAFPDNVPSGIKYFHKLPRY